MDAAVSSPTPPLSNTQKKKQKKAKNQQIIPETPPPQISTTTLTLNHDSAHSPILEVLHKRTRNFAKKIQRIKEYLAKPQETLNPDQVKAIATLPQLEAVFQELEDLKKAVEPLEAQQEQSHSLALSQLQQEAETRVNDSISATKLSCVPVLAALASFISLDSSALHFQDASESEVDAVRQIAAEIKQSDSISSSKHDILAGLLTGTGTWQDIPYARLFHLISTSTIPPPPPPPVEEEVAKAEEVDTAVPPSETLSDSTIPTGSVTEGGLGGSFHFMQASELEDTSAAATPIDREPNVNGILAHPEPELQNQEPTQAEDIRPSEPHTQEPAPLATEHSMTSENLDWAADDSTSSELPSINSLHAKFGTSPAGSGTVTPQAVPQTIEDVAVVSEEPVVALPPATEDGFVAVRRGGPRGESGRGTPHGGDRARGGGRGGFRGGRGGWRGEGEFRGRGGFRGGEGGRGWRGDRGGWRGGPRGRGGAPVAENTAS